MIRQLITTGMGMDITPYWAGGFNLRVMGRVRIRMVQKAVMLLVPAGLRPGV